ncbi:MAG TPA: hypothetical protein VFZ52_00840 [Chryseolinea sp.]
MTPSLRQRLLITVGIFAGLLASFNLFAQNTTSQPSSSYVISSQEEYALAVESIEELAVKLYYAHQKYPKLSYSQVYNNDGSLMGFTVSGVPQSTEADQISAFLVELEVLGKAVNTMDVALLPDSKNEKLESRVSKKQAESSLKTEDEIVVHAPRTNPYDLIASNK